MPPTPVDYTNEIEDMLLNVGYVLPIKEESLDEFNKHSHLHDHKHIIEHLVHPLPLEGYTEITEAQEDNYRPEQRLSEFERFILNPNLEGQKHIEYAKSKIADVFAREPPSPINQKKLNRYSKFVAQAYKKHHERDNVLEDYVYNPMESTDDIAVFEGPDEHHLAIRGTSLEKAYRDILTDTQILLGSLATQAVRPGNSLQQEIDEVNKVIRNIKEKHPLKKISVSGHSKSGAIAEFIGVDNPHIDVYTFNKLEGLPFVSKLGKKNNIHNYRIGGDAWSMLSRNTQTIAPKKPDSDSLERAMLLGGYFIEPELYLPHDIHNFIDRTDDNIANPNIYARQLAAKIGRVVGTVAPIVGGKIYNAYLDQLASNKLAGERTLVDRITRSRQLAEQRLNENEQSLLKNYPTPRALAEDYSRMNELVGETKLKTQPGYHLIYPPTPKGKEMYLKSLKTPASPVNIGEPMIPMPRIPDPRPMMNEGGRQNRANKFADSLNSIRDMGVFGSVIGRNLGEFAGVALYDALLSE